MIPIETLNSKEFEINLIIIKYNECTGTIETEKYFGRLQGT